MRGGEDWSCEIVRAVVLEPVETDVAAHGQNFRVDRVSEIFDVEDALGVDGHRAAFNSQHKDAFRIAMPQSPATQA
jgi:hypothetical protein